MLASPQLWNVNLDVNNDDMWGEGGEDIHAASIYTPPVVISLTPSHSSRRTGKTYRNLRNRRIRHQPNSSERCVVDGEDGVGYDDGCYD